MSLSVSPTLRLRTPSLRLFVPMVSRPICTSRRISTRIFHGTLIDGFLSTSEGVAASYANNVDPGAQITKKNDFLMQCPVSIGIGVEPQTRPQFCGKGTPLCALVVHNRLTLFPRVCCYSQAHVWCRCATVFSSHTDKIRRLGLRYKMTGRNTRSTATESWLSPIVRSIPSSITLVQ